MDPLVLGDVTIRFDFGESKVVSSAGGGVAIWEK